MGNEKRDELDQLIDTALAGYSDAEPLAGLDQRVLERVRLVEAGRRKRVWWGLAVAVAAVAAVVIVSVAPNQRPRQLMGQAFQPAAGHPPGEPAESPRRAERLAPQRHRKPAAHNAARILPKHDRFPTPAPLTAEERALVQLSRFDAGTVRAPADLRPIEIAPIEIQPLRIDEH